MSIFSRILFLIGCYFQSSVALYCSICGGSGESICTLTTPFPTVCPEGSNYCLNNSVSYKGYFFNIVRSCSAALPISYKLSDCSYAGASPNPVAVQCSCTSEACNLDLSKTNLTVEYYNALAGNLCSNLVNSTNINQGSVDTSYATPTDLQLQQIKDLSAGIVLPGKETVAKILGRNVTNPYVIVSSALQNFSAGWMSNAFTALMSVNKFLTTNFSVDQSQFQQQIFNLQQLVNDSAMAFPQQLQNLTVGNFNGNSFLQSLDCFASALRIYPFLPQNSTKSLIKISTNLSEWLKGFQSYFPSQNASMTNMTQTRSFPSSNSLTILTPGISGNFTPPLISQISPTIVTILIVLGILFSKV